MGLGGLRLLKVKVVDLYSASTWKRVLGVPGIGRIVKALHWPRVTDISDSAILYLRAQGPGQGDEHPPTLS